MTIARHGPEWRKASYSSNQTSCVEVIGTLDHVRDSKNRDGPVLAVNVAALVAAAKDDRLDR